MTPKAAILSLLRSPAFVVCVLLLAALRPLNAQKPSPGPGLQVFAGPGDARLGSTARLAVPPGYVFLDADSTRLFLKARGEFVSGQEVGFLTNTNQTWSVLFIFDQSGYVKDDEKDKLDASKLLESIKQGVALGNRERQRRGTPPVEVVGWELPPKYDPAAHNLEWAIRGICQGQPMVNYNTRLLGRSGVMEVILVVAPERLAQTLPVFRKVLAGYAYQPGQTYAEYRAGDKVAKYGLGALVVGVAAKPGLPAWAAALSKEAWALILVAVVILVVLAARAPFFRKLFRQGAPRAQG